MKDELIHYFDQLPLRSQAEVYEWLAKLVEPQESLKNVKIIEALIQREKMGNIQIDEGVILPHIENEFVLDTKIIILKPENIISDWSKEINQVELIIAVFLSSSESIEKKRLIAKFMRQLADAGFVQGLKDGKWFELINEE